MMRFRTAPSRLLLCATLSVVAVAFALPFTPASAILGFEPLSATYVALVTVVVLLYVVSAELVKRAFYRLADRKRLRRLA